MKYILTNPNLIPSAKLLGKQLDFEVKTIPQKELAPTIRWGSSVHPYEQDTKYNDPELIQSSRRDLLASILLKAGVPCVEYYPPVNVPERFPVFARKVVQGHGGIGIQVVFTPQEYEACKRSIATWSYAYEFKYELGIHMFAGDPVRIFKKMWKGQDDEPPYPIRNAGNGYHFKLVDKGQFQKLSDALDKFHEAFPVNFGRLDIGWDLVNRVYRVIEFNTAPCLTTNENTARAYVGWFSNLWQLD